MEIPLYLLCLMVAADVVLRWLQRGDTAQDAADRTRINVRLDNLTNEWGRIMASQSEMAAQVDSLTDQVTKIGAESTKTIQRVADLEQALANQSNVSPELQAAFDRLKAQVKVVDDLTPDAPA